MLVQPRRLPRARRDHRRRRGCATFIPLDRKGGLDKVIAGVGACQAADCRFNKDLTCSAPAIRVGAQGSDAADCLTYEAA